MADGTYTVMGTKRIKMKKRVLLRTHIAGERYDCPLCGKPLDVNDCSLDHIIPQSRGGSNSRENLQLVHQRCNKAKGSKLPKGLCQSQYPFLKKRMSEAKRTHCRKNYADFLEALERLT